MTKHEILKQYFGHGSFRDGQESIIDNILAGHDVLGIMPTGAGKSICYQVPAMLMDGITIVISPLISLMKDQVGALLEVGVPCAYINSSLSYRQQAEVFKRASKGAYKIIYVAPERLMTDDFLYFAENNKISMVTVDEAHCVSQWGQDFRPSYLKITEFVETLSYRPIVSAFTATATKKVGNDIVKILELNEPFQLVTGFDRKNLYFEVIRPKSKDKFSTLVDVLNREVNRDKSGIIYCISRKGVEELCDELCDRGFEATRYHAGLDPDERRENQDDFLFDRSTIMVATNAFGMGIDKSNVSFVIHYNMPKNIESYYQEAGRAGRDGEEAECTLIYTPQDVRTNRWLIENSDDNEELSDDERERIREQDLERLKKMTFYSTTYDCLRGFILKYFGETAPLSCENCSNCNTNFEKLDVTVESQKILSCVYRVMKRCSGFGKKMIADILNGSKNERLLSWHLDTLSTYGIMSDMSSAKIIRIIDFLISEGYLYIDNSSGYDIVKPTDNSKKILFDGKVVSMRMPKEREKKIKKYEKVPVDAELFSRLKALRKKIASRQSVPAFVIFSDATLRNMCEILPKTPMEFMAVSGVGEAKLIKYGDDFIDEVKQYLNSK